MNRGGAESLIMNLYRKIDKSRYQFDFLVHTNEKGDFDEEITSLGGNIFRIPWFNGVNYFAYRRKASQFLEKHPEYLIIHDHISSSAAAFLHEGIKLNRFAIVHCHSGNFYKGMKRLAFSASTFPLRYNADYYLACSEEAGADTFGTQVLKQKNFAILNNAIDLDLYHCDQAAYLTQRKMLGLTDRAVFGHIGRFESVKNHEFLLRTFALIAKEIPNAVLLLAGRGPLENEIRSLARHLKIDSMVQFLGVRSDIPDILKAVDVFVFPSKSEGLGIAAIEAQAAGAYCVLSSGVPESAAIVNNVRLSLEDGEPLWAKKCIEKYRAAANSSRADQIKAVADSGFDLDSTVAKLINLYDFALISKSPAAPL